MAKEIKLPEISEGVENAKVSEVLVSSGDTIQEGDPMIAVETDKATVEVPSTESGTVKEVKAKEGDDLKVGDVILILEAADDEDTDAAEGKDEEEEGAEEEEPEEEDPEQEDSSDEGDKEEEPEEEEPSKDEDDDTEEASSKGDKSKEKEKQEDDEGGDKETQDKDAEKKEDGEEDKQSGVVASPATRKLARELGIDIQSIKGSAAEGGRITEEDVKAAVSQEGAGESSQAGELPDFSKWGSVETVEMSSIRKATAKSTSKSWNAIPHVTQFDQADVTALEAYREKLQGKAADVNITVTAMLIKLVANALERFPEFNASIDMASETIILKRYYHIGVAVDTDKGLLVPVIRDVDKKSVETIASEITSLSAKARDQKLSPEDMEGGTFVLSNLGGIGGTQFTPIVYHPQVAILGVSRSAIQAQFIDGEFHPRQILPLSVSYDHRLIDGAAGARFLRWICDAIEDPLKAMLGS